MVLAISRAGYVASVSGVSVAAYEDLRDLLGPLPADPGVRAALLRLTGSAGDEPPVPELLEWLENYPLPVLAVLDGAVAGGLLDIALHCDVRLCSTTAEFRFARLGARRLLQLIGTDATALLIAAGGRYDAQSALDAGVVSLVADAADLDAEAGRLAATIASRGPIATRFAKEAMRRGLPIPLAEALRIETDLTVLLQSTKDRAEGVAAFLQKRTPTFTGN